MAHLHNSTQEKRTYVLDFGDVERLEPNLCAILGAILETNMLKGATIKIINFDSVYLNKVCTSNGFLDLIAGNPSKPSSLHGCIPYMSFLIENEEEVENYISKFVLLSEKVPRMSELARKKVIRSIFEIYQNAVLHSDSKRVYVCGQFYDQNKRMALTMVDIGKSFKTNINQHSPNLSNLTASECIDWATKIGNTTKKQEDPGGLGLDLIREFLKLNGGKLQIQSSNGYWSEQKGRTFVKDTNSVFHGSIVNIEFNLNDQNSYYMAHEIDLNSIL